jgi:hypothetical protein
MSMMLIASSSSSSDDEAQPFAGGAAHAPAAAFQEISGKHDAQPLAGDSVLGVGWVASKNAISGKWHFIPAARHLKTLRERLKTAHSKEKSRSHFLSQCEVLFGRDAVLTDHPEDRLREALSVVACECKGRLWGVLSPDEDRLADAGRFRHIASVGKSLAAKVPEMEDVPSVGDLLRQYLALRAWLRSFKAHPAGHEFYTVSQISLQCCGPPDSSGIVVGTGPVFHEKVANIREASRWPPRFVPPIGTAVSSRRHGRCTIKGVSREPDMQRHYQHVMSMPIGEIRCRKVWHVVAAWHFFVHVATSSESLAEAFGSILSYMRRCNVNGGLSTKSIVWASQLRAVGLQGMGGEEGFLADALNHHFKCRHPSGWHFTAAKRVPRNFGPGVESAFGDADQSWQRVLRDVRLSEKPEWFRTPLLQLVRSGRMQLATSRLPGPERFLMDVDDARRHRQLTATKQHDAQDRIGSKMWEPKELSTRLWDAMRFTDQTMPRHMCQPLAAAKL